MIKINITGIFILLICALSVGQIKLAGEQDGVFDSSTYIVSNDLVVPLGKKLEFLPNARLLFLPFVGIKVDGQLVMRNVRLASKDSTGNWNGIEVGLNGRIHLENVTIHRSVMGVGVPDSNAIQLFSNITFEGNKSTLRIDDSPVFIREDKPYTFKKADLYSHKEEKPQLTSEQLMNTNSKQKSANLAGKWISVITTLSCIAVSVYSGVASSDKYSEYKNSTEQKQIQKFKNQCQMYRSISIGSGIGAGVAAIALGVCFSIDIKKD